MFLILRPEKKEFEYKWSSQFLLFFSMKKKEVKTEVCGCNKNGKNMKFDSRLRHQSYIVALGI